MESDSDKNGFVILSLPVHLYNTLYRKHVVKSTIIQTKKTACLNMLFFITYNSSEISDANVGSCTGTTGSGSTTSDAFTDV